MYVAPVEIYSDETNRAVMRHPGRKFPGVLVQGDTLHGLCTAADEVCLRGRSQLEGELYEELNDLRNALWGLLTSYKAALGAHDIRLPFADTPPQA
jgi:hypothetical protein